jgi:hypothetical protein
MDERRRVRHLRRWSAEIAVRAARKLMEKAQEALAQAAAET